MLDVTQIRKDFPILKQTVYGKSLVYMDNAATTQKPQVVMDKIIKYYSEENSNIHRGVHFLSEEASENYEKVREQVQSFIHAQKMEEVVFTKGTTDSINLVADTFGQQFINKGDEVIVTEMEHHSNIVPWQIMCQKYGAVLKVIPIDTNGELQLETLDKLITEKTKLLSFTYISNVLGVINPVKKIIEIAHSKGVVVLLDAAQAIQHFPIDVQDLDCDFLVFSGHKMYAGTGVGVLYGKEKLLKQLPPYSSGGGMIKNVSFETTTYADLPFKFESGTANIAGVLSLGSAISYLEDMGREKISRHEKKVIQYAKEKLSEVDDLTIYGDVPDQCGSLAFNLDGVHSYDVGMILDKLGVAVRTGLHCAEPLMKSLGVSGVVRASFAMYNTHDEVDQLVFAVKKAQNMLS